MKRSYTTQMDAARKGILTPQMEQVLENESISQGDLMEKLSQGHIAIPANRNHLNLKAADKISKNILLVGDPARAYQVAQYFDRGITFEQKNREFITLCGNYKMLPITVIGTGIGVDNIEITAVELHDINEYIHRTRSFTDIPAW